jgi:3-hydroxybutyrate dehydrogenase/3-oxoacyl-[acyl-carrier protein] reductase
MGTLEGRVAVITAGSTGIGFGIAEAFIAEGASVVLGNRETDALEREQVDALVDFAAEKYGQLDIIVNCAGGCDGWAPIGELSDEAWLKGLEWNASTAFWGTRRALKYMLPAGYGRIINIASIEGKIASKVAVSHYIAGKHAMIGLTKATAVEYGTTGVTCNAICPGPIETELMKDAGAQVAAASGITYEAFLEDFANDCLTKELQTVEQVAGMAVLLAGPLGNGMTGATYNVDGGSAPF